jgi:hypothetical protein
MYYGKLKVSNVLELLKEYEDYSVSVFEDEGIKLFIADTYVSAEIYGSTHDEFQLETKQDLIEHLKWIESMQIYRDLTVKKLLELLQPYADKDFYVCEEENIVILQHNNQISLEYAG